jgi:hypothetical protein
MLHHWVFKGVNLQETVLHVCHESQSELAIWQQLLTAIN